MQAYREEKKFFTKRKKGFTASVKIFLDKIRDMIDKKESSSAGRKTAKFTKKEPAGLVDRREEGLSSGLK